MSSNLTAEQMERLIASGPELMHIKAFLPAKDQEKFHASLKKIVTEHIGSGAVPSVADMRQIFDEAMQALPDSQDINSAKQRLKRIRDEIDLTRPSPSSGHHRNGGRGAA